MMRQKGALRAGMIVAALLAGVCPAHSETASTPEAVARDVRKDLGAGFTIETTAEGFVLAANLEREPLEQCKETVRKATHALRRMYFQKNPDKPLAIYLFGDKASYEDYCVRRYGHKPTTPYGFFWPPEHKLVMNIATGRGTLVHELVHPLLKADFPEVPVWFNEGLASLYEQCQFEGEGLMRGLVNWRLPRLQRALAEDRLIPLARLLRMSAEEFYDDKGLAYAEARYLCLYLQEQGLLDEFYRKFRAAAGGAEKEADRRAQATLEAVAKRPLAELERAWAKWARALEWQERGNRGSE